VDQLTIQDVLQKSFIAMSMGGIDRITTLNVVLNIMMSFLVGLFIFYIYKKTFQGVLYQQSFNISLIISSTVTSLVIMTISGNLILSLGMVGALSIVRFRTPIKDSMDLAFLFWAISAGIANGVGYYNISIVGSIMIAIFLLLITRRKAISDAYLLVLQLSAKSDEKLIMDHVVDASEMIALKSKTVTSDLTELTIELKLKNNDTAFINELLEGGGVTQATFVSYDQDMSSV